MDVHDEEQEPLSELEQLVLDLFPIGLTHQMLKAYPNVNTGQVEDAVLTAIEQVHKRLETGRPVDDLKGYLATVAHNALKKDLKRTARRGEVPIDERRDEPTSSAEESALRSAAIDILKAEIRRWENANVREVMLIYLDVLAYGEPLTSDEVAEMVGHALGEEISAGSVRTWKARGMKRLHTFITDSNYFETDAQEKS